MCGRFGLSLGAEDLAELLEVDLEQLPVFGPRYNIAPSQDLLALRIVDDSPQPTLLRWGLLPFWAKDKRLAYKLINARSETAAQKPAFRAAFKHRRCLIAADGFYEWKKVGKVKEPYHIGLKDQRPFCFAGLWESWVDQETGEVVESATILTTGPNDLVAPLHERMPVIVRPDLMKGWLSGDDGRLDKVFSPYDPSLMECWPVSPRVNRPIHDDPQLRLRQERLL